jgi:hypothetical protein
MTLAVTDDSDLAEDDSDKNVEGVLVSDADMITIAMTGNTTQ